MAKPERVQHFSNANNFLYKSIFPDFGAQLDPGLTGAFTWSTAVTFAECQARCQGDSTCQFFGFIDDASKLCVVSAKKIAPFKGNMGLVQMGQK